MSKYQALNQFLRRQGGAEISMSFDDLENVLGFPLPRSARQYPPWWSNQTGDGHSQCRAWMEAGWRTARTDLVARRIVFVRQGVLERQGDEADASGQGSVTAGPGVKEVPSLFWADDHMRIDLTDLTLVARRLLKDYEREAGGNLSAALGRAVHEAALARRARLIDAIGLTGVRGGVDSVALIREDRDAR